MQANAYSLLLEGALALPAQGLPGACLPGGKGLADATLPGVNRFQRVRATGSPLALQSLCVLALVTAGRNKGTLARGNYSTSDHIGNRNPWRPSCFIGAVTKSKG